MLDATPDSSNPTSSARRAAACRTHGATSQSEHVKESYEERGVSEDEAEERAARTVNKERREKGETKDSDDD